MITLFATWIGINVAFVAVLMLRQSHQLPRDDQAQWLEAVPVGAVSDMREAFGVQHKSIQYVDTGAE